MNVKLVLAIRYAKIHCGAAEPRNVMDNCPSLWLPKNDGALLGPEPHSLVMEIVLYFVMDFA